MKKIIFLTLMMILGMSSVSFGKKYLCVSKHTAILGYQGVENTKSSGNFLVLTNRDDYIYSVKSFGVAGKLWCKDNAITGTSVVKNSKVISCNKKSQREGNTKVEFNMNFHPDVVISFQMFISEFGKRNISDEYSEIYLGSCEEIKF